MSDTTPDTTARPRCRDLRPGLVLVWTGDPRWDSVDGVKIIDRRKDNDTGWWMTDGSGIADDVWDRGTAWQTVRALCDGYDEAQRLRSAWATERDGAEGLAADLHAARDEAQRLRADVNWHRGRATALVNERDAARQALADLIEELRGLDPADAATSSRDYGRGYAQAIRDLRAVIDRHAPTEEATP